MTYSEQFRLLPNALLAALHRFNDKGGLVLSSHVAMSMMLALFPFIMFIVALAVSLSRSIPANDLIELLIGSWPPEVAEPLESEMRAVLAGSGTSVITLSGLLVLYFASNGVNAVRIAMTYAYHAKETRPFWKTQLQNVLFVLVGAALVLAVITVQLAMPLYLSLMQNATTEMLEWVGPIELGGLFASSKWQSMLGNALLVFVVAACHLWLPGGRRPIRDLWPGVALTLILWVVAEWGFSIYMQEFAAYSKFYAGLAGAMAALIFLYLMAAILILGAELNGALETMEKEANTVTG
jgi:membrane protein